MQTRKIFVSFDVELKGIETADKLLIYMFHKFVLGVPVTWGQYTESHWIMRQMDVIWIWIYGCHLDMAW